MAGVVSAVPQQQQRGPTSSVSPAREQVITRRVDDHSGAIERIRGNLTDATFNRSSAAVPVAAAAAVASSMAGRVTSPSPDRGRGVSSYYADPRAVPAPAAFVAALNQQQQRQQQQYQQQLYEQMVGPIQAGLVDQPTWDDRMSRIRTRKMIVENILNDLPG